MQQQEERMQELKFEPENKRDDPYMGKGIPKHQKLNDTDDIDVFLSTFQSHMTNFKVHKRYWVPNLVPLLTDRIRDVYATLDDAVRNDYDKIEDAILDNFNVTPEETTDIGKEECSVCDIECTYVTVSIGNHMLFRAIWV